MEFTHRCSRFASITSIAALLFTAGCAGTREWPIVSSDAPGERGNPNLLVGEEVTIPIRSMERFIANRLPGILIRGNSIVIRGNSTFAATSTNQALIMVDGREMDTVTFLNMNPADVERIEVLRGSEAAFYGSRGANGVLVVTTQ